jgi:hypothetical protein
LATPAGDGHKVPYIRAWALADLIRQHFRRRVT